MNGEPWQIYRSIGAPAGLRGEDVMTPMTRHVLATGQPIRAVRTKRPGNRTSARLLDHEHWGLADAIEAQREAQARLGAALLLAALREATRCETPGCPCFGDTRAHAQHHLDRLHAGSERRRSPF